MGVAVVLSLALAGCSDGGREAQPAPSAGSSEPPTSTTVTSVRAAATTTRAPERLTADARLRMDGIGPIRIGMTVDQASAAAGVPIRVTDHRETGNCQYASVRTIEGLDFLVVDGRIARVGVHEPGRFRTVSGVGIGASEAEVHRIYGGRITVERHFYSQSGHYLVYTAPDPSLPHLSLLFETDGRVVTTFRSGLKRDVARPEGCV